MLATNSKQGLVALGLAWSLALGPGCGGGGGNDGDDVTSVADDFTGPEPTTLGSTSTDPGTLDDPVGDGTVGGCIDADGDGFLSAECGGEDCDDADATTYPGADDNDDFAWRFEMLGDGSDSAPSLALDAEGIVHVVWAAEGLRRASNPTGLWWEEQVDPEGVGSPSIAIDDQGEVHVAYFADGASGSELRHATTAGGGWTIDVIEAGASGSRTAIVVDDTGMVHVAYVAAEVRYAVGMDGNFASEVVATLGTSFYDSSVALALADDGLHLAYMDPNNAAIHALRMGLGWAEETIASEYGTFPYALVVDGNGTFHAALFISASASIEVANNSGGTWDTTVVDDQVGPQADLAVGPDDSLYLSWWRAAEGLQYARNVDGTWPIEPVVSGGRSSIGVSESGIVHIAFSGNMIRYARRIPPDGIDQDCDGVDGVDGDGDGHASVATGGGDCDDERAEVHPGTDDPPGDGVDQDCDGSG